MTHAHIVALRTDRIASQPLGHIATSGEEHRLRLMIEAAPNAMIMVDDQGLIILVNSQTEKLFGYSRGELLGRTVELLVPHRIRDHHSSYRRGFFNGPDTRAMGTGRDLYGLRKDGSEVPIEIGLNPMPTEDGQFVLASIIDITERLNAEKLARTAQADTLRQSILDSLPFSIIATDLDGRIVSANPATEQLLGYRRSALIGRSALLLHDADELALRAAEISRQAGFCIPPNFQVIVASGSQDTADEREWTYVREDGSQVPVNIAITAMRDEAGLVHGFLKVAYDITQRKRSEAVIRHMAHHDALTGLPNRTLLQDRLELATRQAQRNKHKFAVLMLDLDHFKRVNDSLGHQVGDRLLLAVSKCLQRRVREVDTVARLGGDEFVIVLSEVTSRESLETLIAEIARAVSTPIKINGHELMVTPSIGGCLFPDDGNDATTLLKHADTAMYQAKSNGRSNFQWFTDRMQQQGQDKLALSAALRRAIEQDELKVYYQPQLSLQDGRVIGMEALVRWSSPELGDISPERFIPIAEESGLILQLGDWVLRTACRQCVAIQGALGRRLALSVNVSPRQFQQGDWACTVRRALDESGLEPQDLELEITEGMLMLDLEGSIDMLRNLRAVGVAVVVDDFGVGFSSLSYLTRFPVDKIKIDRSFVRDLASDAADAAIINAILAMARSLNLRVVAEGVETEQQQRYLQERGCDEVQGFRYSIAVASDRFVELIPAIEQQFFAAQ